MKSNAKKILSFLLTFMMLTSLLPVGVIVFAEGENDTTLSQLNYTFNGTETEITLVADDLYPTLQENRYVVILPYVTKTLAQDKLPQVLATATNTGATALVTDATLFPGTAKIAVTAADGVTARNYYIRFKYQPGSIGPITNSFTTGLTKIFHDLEPLSLTELREVYNDVGAGWEAYNMACADHVINGISDTPNTSYLPATGDYITVANTWRQQWITKQQTSSTSTASTTYFNGASRIASAYSHRNQSVAGDWMTFDIDRGATIWVIGNGGSTPLPAYANDSSWGGISTSTAPYTLRESISTAYNRPYYKHYDAGTITLPKSEAASTTTRPPMVIFMWDAPGTGDTSLASMTATVNGVPQTIDIIPDQTTYRVMVPQGCTLSLDATLTDSTAEMLISQTATSPGTATISVASGRNVATYTIEFDSLSSDSSLKSLTYNHPMMGNQSIALTSGVTEYNVVLPYGISSEIPQIAAEANHGYATIESITQAGTMPGSASVVVKAEDNSSSTYTVNFSVEPNPPVVDHLPGHVTNVMTRHKGSAEVYDTPQVHANVFAVEGSGAVPATWYSEGTGYATTEERIAAAMSDENPYWTNDKKIWAFGDRDPKFEGSGTSNSPYRVNSQNVMVTKTSSLLLGDKVTRVLVLNAEKDVTVPVDDFYTFTIDKAATVYIAAPASGTSIDERYNNKGWIKDTSIAAYRGLNTVVNIEVTPTEGDPYLQYYSIPNGYSTFSAVYSKRYSAGANVTIPNRGATTSSGFMVFVVWDECNTNTMLTDLKIDGTTITGFTPTKATYDIGLAAGTTQIPDLSVTPAFNGASVQVVNPESLPGTATINVTAADGVTIATYHVNYTITIANGDVNGDGQITVADVVMAAEIAVGTTGYTPEQIGRANVSNKNDTTVDISDVILLLERVLGSTNTFPIDL